MGLADAISGTVSGGTARTNRSATVPSDPLQKVNVLLLLDFPSAICACHLMLWPLRPTNLFYGYRVCGWQRHPTKCTNFRMDWCAWVVPWDSVQVKRFALLLPGNIGSLSMWTHLLNRQQTVKRRGERLNCFTVYAPAQVPASCSHSFSIGLRWSLLQTHSILLSSFLHAILSLLYNWLQFVYLNTVPVPASSIAARMLQRYGVDYLPTLTKATEECVPNINWIATIAFWRQMKQSSLVHPHSLSKVTFRYTGVDQAHGETLTQPCPRCSALSLIHFWHDIEQNMHNKCSAAWSQHAQITATSPPADTATFVSHWRQNRNGSKRLKAEAHDRATRFQ